MCKPNLYHSIALCCLGVLYGTTPAAATPIATPSGYSGLAITRGGVGIGNLFTTVSGYLGYEQSYFELLPPYRSLMSDTLGKQFRFFQVITYDDEPTTWNGNIITSASSTQHAGTVVDVPAGGWDYMAPGGDDYAPFYESDTAIDPVTGKPYAFGWAYTGGANDVHSPDTSTRGWVKSLDQPVLELPRDRTLIETYIAYIDAPLRARRSFDVLGGFSWGIFTGPSGYQSGIAPTGIPLESINVAELQSALNRSGYNSWTIANAAPVPESSTVVTVIIGMVLIGLKRCRRPRIARRKGTVIAIAPVSSNPLEAANSNHFGNE
jgi:hypothetical protein